MNNKLVIVLLAILLVIPISFAFELNSNELTKTTCQGNTLLFTASVFGTGNFNVNLDGSASSWSTAVPQGFILNNNGKTIYIYSTPNNNVAPGSYSLNLIVSGQQETKTIPFTINVENCHNLQINGETSKAICQGDITSYTYSLTNLGNYKETYNLNVEGPNFITLSQDLITLNKGESKSIYAYIAQNSKSSSFTVSATNQYGTAEINSILNVNSCYDFSVSTDKDFINFCEHSQENVFITVTNTGVNQDNYKIQLKGPEWANINQQTLSLNPQQSGSVNLVLNPDYNVKGNFDIDLTITSKEGSKTKTIKAQVNKCHDVYIDIIEKEINLCNNAQIPLLVKNTGSFEKEFRIETSEQWVSLNNYQVKLGAGEEIESNLILDVSNIEKRSYDIYARVLALDGSGLSADDKIKINVLDENQCHNTQITSDDSIQVTQGSSTTLPITIKNNGNEKLIYEISVTGEGSSFTQLNPSILELNPNSAETIYLYSAPSAEVEPRDYNVDISISYNNNLLASKSINIDVKESELTKKEYIPFLMRIVNFFKELFAQPLDNTTNVTEPVINEPEEEQPEIQEDVNKTSMITNLYNQIKPYWLYAVVGIFIIIILIVIFSSGGKEDSDEEWDEKEEEDEDEKDGEEESDEKPLKIGRWILGIIVILGLIYTQVNYNWFNYIKKYAFMLWEYVIIYKFYILIALILLLIIILIIKYWSSILEFFEEEEEIPKKKKNNKKRKKK
jgi:uncharacterized membrane protein